MATVLCFVFSYDQIRHCQLNDIVGDKNVLQSKIWVKKWMYERKSCPTFAYQLNDDSIGICFADKTKFSKFAGARWVCEKFGIDCQWKKYAIFILSICSHIDYMDARGQTMQLTTTHQRSIANFKIKMKMFTEFNAHMREKLKDSNYYKFLCRSNNQSRPSVHSWFTTAESIVMYLTNGIVQVCRKTRIIKKQQIFFLFDIHLSYFPFAFTDQLFGSFQIDFGFTWWHSYHYHAKTITKNLLIFDHWMCRSTAKYTLKIKICNGES